MKSHSSYYKYSKQKKIFLRHKTIVIEITEDLTTATKFYQSTSKPTKL